MSSRILASGSNLCLHRLGVTLNSAHQITTIPAKFDRLHLQLQPRDFPPSLALGYGPSLIVHWCSRRLRTTVASRQSALPPVAAVEVWHGLSSLDLRPPTSANFNVSATPRRCKICSIVGQARGVVFSSIWTFTMHVIVQARIRLCS